jgi:hypothetical protein
MMALLSPTMKIGVAPETNRTHSIIERSTA